MANSRGAETGSTKPAFSWPRDLASPLCLFWLLYVLYCYVHQAGFYNPTPVSRLDLLRAAITQGTVVIDIYHTNTCDKAVFNGHFYSDKAPGTAALGVPAFALAVALGSWLSVPVEAKEFWLLSSWMTCAGSVALLAAFGGAALFCWLRRFVSARTALLVALAQFLGAAPLPYSTAMFSHAMVVGLLAIAMWAIERGREGGVRKAGRGIGAWVKANRWDMLAGHVSGWALASEYTSGIVVVGLFVWLLRSRWARAVSWWVGAIPPLLLIPGYSYLCFGNVFILPYSLSASYPEMQEGIYAIKWPNIETAFKLLFSPTRGLLFWSPFLLIGWLSLHKVFERTPRLFWLTYAVPLLQIVVISGRSWDWQAGPTLGPRYLAPMLPLLALPCALGVQRFTKLGFALAVYSIGITTLATLTDACPSSDIYNPLLELHIPLFLNGEFSPNLGMVLGLPPYASVAVFYVILIGGIWWLWRRLPKEEPVKVEWA